MIRTHLNRIGDNAEKRMEMTDPAPNGFTAGSNELTTAGFVAANKKAINNKYPPMAE